MPNISDYVQYSLHLSTKNTDMINYSDGVDKTNKSINSMNKKGKYTMGVREMPVKADKKSAIPKKKGKGKG